MYKCGNCNTKYDLTEEHYNHIFEECEEKGVSKTIIICPGCDNARLVGGEEDWDEFDGKPCIMMFGYDIKDVDDITEMIVFYGEEG